MSLATVLVSLKLLFVEECLNVSVGLKLAVSSELLKLSLVLVDYLEGAARFDEYLHATAWIVKSLHNLEVSMRCLVQVALSVRQVKLHSFHCVEHIGKVSKLLVGLVQRGVPAFGLHLLY